MKDITIDRKINRIREFLKQENIKLSICDEFVYLEDKEGYFCVPIYNHKTDKFLATDKDY